MTTSVSKVTPCPTGFTDHIYKEEAGVKIPLRVWKAPKSGTRPWLFWIHGGGFISGKHVIPNAWVVPAFQMYNYHVISVAYRFIPQVTMTDIIQDCMDAYSWCRSNLPQILGEENIDLNAFVTAGDSAGGTMSTLLPHFMQPRPKVVIDVFGVVDPTWEKFLTSSSFHEPYLRDRTDEEMEKLLNDKDTRNAEFICPWDWELKPNMSEDDLRVFWGLPDFKVEDKHYERMDLNKYLVKKGVRFTLLHERHKFQDGEEGEKEFMEHMKTQSSYWLLMKNKGKGYPPTFFLHGTGDNAVPVEQSYQMAKALKELGVDVGEKYCPEGEHCFENKIEGPYDPDWDTYITPTMEFVEKHIHD